MDNASTIATTNASSRENREFRSKFQARHNSARKFVNNARMVKYALPAPDRSSEGRHFRQHIRSYNHVLSFTSMGVHIDENVVATGRGIYTFRAQAGRLLQQYVVDNYVKIESGRLRWIRTHQNNIRAEVYQGLQDALHVGETTTDRPDLLTRIFRAKFEQLKDDVINKGVLGKRDPRSRRYLYKEIPEHYCWHQRDKEWNPRRSRKKVIGRIYTVSPTEGEKLYLRVLLSHIRGPTSWESLLSVNGTCFPTFKKAAEQWGFLESDNSIRDCLIEASALRSPCALTRLFAIILIFCEPTDVRRLWDEFYNHMVEDYPSASNVVGSSLTNMLLRDLDDLLNQHGKHIKDYDLPELTFERGGDNMVPRVIQEELMIHIPNEDVESVDKLNIDQLFAFNTIMSAIDHKQKFLMRIGDGVEPTKQEDMVMLPCQIAIPWEGKLKFKDMFQLCQDLRAKHEDEFQKLWNIWKDEQALTSISTIDNKVHRLKVYSLGWGCTVITDKTQLWKMVKENY
ncbi:Helitron helicase-like domain [Sesbania bispinosa]|nr:Helitron helicase-like domain [Sesbania bispinosa]